MVINTQIAMAFVGAVLSVGGRGAKEVRHGARNRLWAKMIVEQALGDQKKRRKHMKVNWFKALAMAGLVADALTQAAGEDGVITFEEALTIVARMAPAAGIKFDTTGSKFVVELVTRVLDSASDGKVSINEVVEIARYVCAALKIDLDETGFNV